MMVANEVVSGGRPVLKEKLILYYDQIFSGQDPSKNYAAFWDEFFLLWVNVSRLEEEIMRLNCQDLLKLKRSINGLSSRAISTIQEFKNIKAVNALQTLCGLTRGVVRKTSGGFGFDVIDVLFGFDRAEALMKTLIERLCEFLTEDFPSTLKSLSLKTLLTLVTIADNINENTMLEYLLINSVFETLVQILGSPALRQVYGDDCVLLLTLLVNYRKHEGVNPYIVKLSILDDELALNV